MKSLLALLSVLLLTLAFASCSHSAASMKMKATPEFQQDISPPSADPSELFNFPKKEDGIKGWLEWLMGAAVFLAYEILVRIKPTSRTYSIIGLLYNLLNWVQKDKSKTGASFKIDPG